METKSYSNTLEELRIQTEQEFSKWVSVEIVKITETVYFEDGTSDTYTIPYEKTFDQSVSKTCITLFATHPIEDELTWTFEVPFSWDRTDNRFIQIVEKEGQGLMSNLLNAELYTRYENGEWVLKTRSEITELEQQVREEKQSEKKRVQGDAIIGLGLGGVVFAFGVFMLTAVLGINLLTFEIIPALINAGIDYLISGIITVVALSIFMN
jgi:hypothetical protein